MELLEQVNKGEEVVAAKIEEKVEAVVPSTGKVNNKAHRRLRNQGNTVEAKKSKLAFMERMDAFKVEKDDEGKIIRDDRTYKKQIEDLKKELNL